MRNKRFDFGYSWYWTYGHLVPTSIFVAATIVAILMGAAMWAILLLGGLSLWFFVGLCISVILLRVNEPFELPDERYLSRTGEARVLDLGCGSGRTSIMVGTARPGARITALDNRTADYIRNNGVALTMRNIEVAEIADRVHVEEGDMRQLPFESGSFDAAVSSYAIDHLEREEIPIALAEVNRILIPDGEFLLMVIVPNAWLWLSYGILMHGGKMPRRVFWRGALQDAGFTVTREGSTRGTAYFLARRTGDARKSVSVTSFRPAKGNVLHGFDIRSMAVPTAATGLIMFAGALALRAGGLDISWWWVASAIPIGMHVGPLLILAGAVLRWVVRRRA